jgi:hypothetical protein
MTRAGRIGTTAALLTLAAWVGAIAWCGGAVKAGWQFEEDYELIEIRQALDSGRGMIGTAVHYAAEVERRARIYYLPRVLQAAAFGDRIEGYRWSFVLLGMTAMFLFFGAMRLWRLGRIEALLLTLLMFAGPPMTVWWRMGTTENLGMFFLSAALYAGFRSSGSAARSGSWKALYVLCAACASLSKESFLVILPAMVWVQLWHEAEQTGGSIRSAAARNLAVIAVLAALAAVQLGLILGWTGSVIGGYVGVEGLSAAKLLRAGKDWVAGGYPWLLAALMGLMLIDRVYISMSRSVSGPVPGLVSRSGWPQALVSVALIITPLLILFQKTGMGHYYVLPAKLAHVILLITALRLVAMSRTRSLKWIAILLLMTQVTVATVSSWQASRDFLDRSLSVQALIETVRDSGPPEDRVLVVADAARHIEWSRASKIYLEHLAGRTSVFLYPIIRPKLSPFEKFLVYEQQHRALKIFGDQIGAGSKAKLIVCLPQTEIWFLIASKSWFQRDRYDRTVVKNLTFYTKKGGS